METTRKKITVTVTVPPGNACDDKDSYCDFWYRDTETKRCYCILFDMVELEQRFRPNMVTGKDVMKCDKCRKLYEKTTGIEWIIKTLQEKADFAHDSYIEIAQKDEYRECESKLEPGRFTQEELDAHYEVSAWYFKHKAFCEAIKIVRDEMNKSKAREAGNQ